MSQPSAPKVPQWRVSLSYQTPDGRQATWAGEVQARNADSAISKAEYICTSQRDVARFVFENATGPS